MVTDTKTLYLELLKKTLSDYLNVDNPYANGVPRQFWWKKNGFKNQRNKWLVKLLRRSKIIVLRDDGLSAKERQEKREKGLDWPLMQAQTMIGIKRSPLDLNETPYSSASRIVHSLHDRPLSI